MAKDTGEDGTRGFTTPNPSINPDTHTVNPSSPTTGTEGWGTTADEHRVLGSIEPSVVQPGQFIRQDDQVPSPGASAASRNDRTLRCADAGNTNCRWETSGSSDEEVIEAARLHAQTEHGWNDWTDALRDRVRSAIRQRDAA